jgi:SAM-dependent methyltransferase
MNDYDSSGIESDIWGARAHAEIEDEASRSLFQVILDAVSVGKGTKLLDIGCGSGLASAMGANLGAKVSGLDSSPNLLKIAKKRVPDGDFRLGDMNSSFPWQDNTFDVITAFNSLFFATDQVSTLSEVRRVIRPSGRVAIVYWGLPEEVEASAYLDALKPLMPPPPEPPNPFSTADQLEELARKAQLKPQRVFDVDWSWKYPDFQTALRGLLSAGPSTIAIRIAREQAVRDRITKALKLFKLPNGDYQLKNLCRCLLAQPE